MTRLPNFRKSTPTGHHLLVTSAMLCIMTILEPWKLPSIIQNCEGWRDGWRGKNV